MGVSLKDCYDSRPIDFTWSTLRDYPGVMRGAQHVVPLAGSILIWLTGSSSVDLGHS